MLDKIENWVLKTKLGHFLFIFVVGSLLTNVVLSFSYTETPIISYIILFIIALFFSITDNNKKWY